MFKIDEETMTRNTAYSLWEEAGCPEGRSDEFWFEAEKQVGMLVQGTCFWNPVILTQTPMVKITNQNTVWNWSAIFELEDGTTTVVE